MPTPYYVLTTISLTYYLTKRKIDNRKKLTAFSALMNDISDFASNLKVLLNKQGNIIYFISELAKS